MTVFFWVVVVTVLRVLLAPKGVCSGDTFTRLSHLLCSAVVACLLLLLAALLLLSSILSLLSSSSLFLSYDSSQKSLPKVGREPWDGSVRVHYWRP